ncbi:MAG: hypothetical protein V1802_00740 [Candidatus Aenigmatarchaeota archaeon]
MSESEKPSEVVEALGYRISMDRIQNPLLNQIIKYRMIEHREKYSSHRDNVQPCCEHVSRVLSIGARY